MTTNIYSFKEISELVHLVDREVFSSVKDKSYFGIRKVYNVKSLKEIFDNCRKSLAETQEKLDLKALTALLKKAKNLQEEELSSASSKITECSFLSRIFCYSKKVRETRNSLHSFVNCLQDKVDSLDQQALAKKMKRIPFDQAKQKYIQELTDSYAGVEKSDLDKLPKEIRNAFENPKLQKYAFYELLSKKRFKDLVAQLDFSLKKSPSREDKLDKFFEFLQRACREYRGIIKEGGDPVSLIIITLLLSKEIRPTILKAKNIDNYPNVFLLEAAFEIIYGKKDVWVDTAPPVSPGKLFSRMVNDFETGKISDMTKAALKNSSTFTKIERYICKLPADSRLKPQLKALAKNLLKLHGKEKFFYSMPLLSGRKAIAGKRENLKNLLISIRGEVANKLGLIAFEEQRKVKAEAAKQAQSQVIAMQQPVGAQSKSIVDKAFSMLGTAFSKLGAAISFLAHD